MKNIVIWIFGLAIAVAAGLNAMGAIATDKAPALAFTLSPLNGFAAENLAAASIKDSLVKNRGQFPARLTPATTRVGRQAFLAEPVTPVAVAVLALGRSGSSQQKLMDLALMLSRRQPLVTGWMIEDSGKRRNIPALLNHYDTILRTNSSAASAVMPIFASALSNDDFISPFENLLRKQPPWASQFWATVVSTPEALNNAVLLRKSLYRPNESDETFRDAELIHGLVNNWQFKQAESLYDLIAAPGETGSLIENSSFDSEPVYSPIDWQLFATGEYGAAVTGGTLNLSAIRNSGGLFARQIVKLPLGDLYIESRTTETIPPDTRIFMSLTCAEDIVPLPKAVSIPIKTNYVKQKISNDLTICNYYWINIIGYSSEHGDGFNLNFEYITIGVI